jgi:GNAT superfamily N-acetyltransferase
MPFAMRHRDDPTPSLTSLAGLEVHHVWDADFMARLQGRSIETMEARFADGHRAYVAWLNESAAAWGWVATRTATIGELDTTFALPSGERYLWNFVTLPAHRGRGIYPRLIQAIVSAEAAAAERFWIAYAPENHASKVGVAKAGFTLRAEMSFDASGLPALRPTSSSNAGIVSRVLGIRETSEALTPCWRCVRAGRGAMACVEGQCRCDYQEPKSGCAA